METMDYFGHEQHPLALICRDKKHNEEHEPCAKLPRVVNAPFMPQSLSLKTKPGRHDNPNCCRCNKLCTSFVYSSDHSSDRGISYILHPLCATTVEIKIQHESHNKHPLVAICTEIMPHCDACGEEHKGFFFLCGECNFWLHQDCASLPSIVKPRAHAHSLVLAYSLSDYYQLAWRCHMCRGKFFGKGAYCCAQCDHYVAHLSCAMSDVENSGQGFINLPAEGDLFPSLTIRLLDEKRNTEDINEDDKKLAIEKYHNHPLILHDNTKHDHQSSSSSTSTQSVCNACIQPIVSSPFWGCVRSDCHFLLHDLCVNIPSHIISNKKLASLSSDVDYEFFNSTYPCIFCRRPCNGFSYLYDYGDIGSIAAADVECSSAPDAITHASHDQHHVLFLSTPGNRIPITCCRDKLDPIRLYRCVTCDFGIHVECTLLPKKVRHKFDKHPLELIFFTPTEKYSDCCFCEFCEEDVDQRYWFYHCAECDQSFHIKCIPSVGFLSKVKFGGALNVSCHPRHPMILTRMLMEGNQRCGYCKEIIEGFVDEMAFYCEECEFWIHFSCARNCITDQSSRQSLLWHDGLSVRRAIRDLEISAEVYGFVNQLFRYLRAC